MPPLRDPRAAATGSPADRANGVRRGFYAAPASKSATPGPRSGDPARGFGAV